MPLFDWTGNPWVDAGIAALCILQKKDIPEYLTLDDCKGAAGFIKVLYPKWAARGHGFVKIFHNLPAFNTSVEQPDSLKEELRKLKEKLASELNIKLKMVSKTRQFKEQSKEVRKRHVTNDYKLSVFERRYTEFIDDMVAKLETIGSGHTCIATGQHEADRKSVV